MSDNDKPSPVDRMTEAYEQMLERVDLLLERVEENTIPSLRNALEQAREKAVELNELTREEADKLADYVERDMHDAAQFLADTGEEFRNWWRFDVQLVEGKLLDMFAKVADRTRVELEQFAERARQASRYRTGEFTGPGTLVCTECGKALHFHQAGRIPPCPECRGSAFRRQENESDSTPK